MTAGPTRGTDFCKPDVVIETARLTLRHLRSADAQKIFRMSQEEGMRTWLPSQVYRDEAHAASVLEFLASQYRILNPPIAPLVLGVQLRSSGELVGHVGLSRLGDSVEVGFAIEQCQQRKGLGTEAVRAMCEWAAAELSLPAIVGVTAAGNVASQGVLLRAGFVRKREQVMLLQGSEQPVIIFEFSPPRSSAERAAL